MTASDLGTRTLNQYLDVMLHAFSSGKRIHSDTRDKLLHVITSAANGDETLRDYMLSEIAAYNSSFKANGRLDLTAVMNDVLAGDLKQKRGTYSERA